jgi:hypothetical protein
VKVVSVVRGQWIVGPTLVLRMVSTRSINDIVPTSSIIPERPFCDIVDELIIVGCASPLNGVPPQPSGMIESFGEHTSMKTDEVYCYVLTARAV